MNSLQAPLQPACSCSSKLPAMLVNFAVVQPCRVQDALLSSNVSSHVVSP